MTSVCDECVLDESDPQLVRMCLNGGAENFRRLVERHQPAVIGYVRGRLGGRSADAREEIAQETFVRAFKSLKLLRKPDSFLPWLIGIADRVCRETQRANWRWRTMLARKQRELLLARQTTAPDDEIDPEIHRAVAHLSEPYRHIILLRFFEDLSCAQIAGQLNMPLGTVTKTLSRAYEMLRADLTPKPAQTAPKAVQS